MAYNRNTDDGIFFPDTQPDADDPFWDTFHVGQDSDKKPSDLAFEHDPGVSELDLEALEEATPSKPTLTAETGLARYVAQVLAVCPEAPAKKLQKLFAESASQKMSVGTLCSGSDAVIDVLQAISCSLAAVPA
eukprot:s1427_g17.t1